MVVRIKTKRGEHVSVILILFSVNSIGGALLFQPKAFYMGYYCFFDESDSNMFIIVVVLLLLYRCCIVVAVLLLLYCC